ncbi:MAG: DUF222 domain-containing protein [Candidatus Dormibacteraceae bacterium]
MSVTSAADRLCVGAQLESLPKVASALSHLREQLGEKGCLFDEEEMLGFARECPVSDLRKLCHYARHVADRDGFFNDAEESFTRRRLHISQMTDRLHAIDGLLDPVRGAALKTALDVLAKRKGPDDERTRSQRMADAAGELAHHAMDQGTPPGRNGVKPHINLTMTLKASRRAWGAAGGPRALAPHLDPDRGAHRL